MCSSHLVDDTDKMCILVDGCNTSDHFAISVTIKMSFSSPHVKPNRVYSTKLRWDRADLSQYEDVLFRYVGTDSLTLSRISPRVRVRVSVSIVYRIATGGYSWIWPIHLPVDALLCSHNCCSVHNSDLEHYYNCIS